MAGAITWAGAGRPTAASGALLAGTAGMKMNRDPRLEGKVT